ncbi:hypothetical protein ACFE04_000753 [Oxalis oulophora]
MVNKAAVSAVSVILVVGVVIGTVAITRNVGDKNKDLTPQMKMATTICNTTDYQDACKRSMSNVSTVDDPKEFIKAAIVSTMGAVQKALNLSDSLVKDAKDDKMSKMALGDCKDLMSYAIDQLQASLNTVGDSKMTTLGDHAYDIQNWLSSVIAYQESCLDQFDEKAPLKDSMKDGMVDAKELTSNALAIVAQLQTVLASLGLQLNIPSTPSSRKLLGFDGYPTWFPTTDRKLLQDQRGGNLSPNAVVAKDGSGKFKTITAALATVPKKNPTRFVIYVKAGTYDEYVTVTKDMTNVYMYGDGPRSTIVTGRKSNKDGITTQNTASFNVLGKGFIGKNMGFSNTAGAIGHQAVALRVNAEQVAFFNCKMDGYQDTLYTQALRQFYRNCEISGTVDFIFGDATVIIQNSVIIVRRPMDNQQNTVTAHGRSYKYETTGLVIQNCRIVPEQQLFPDRFKIPTFLGRPWKEYSRTVIMESLLADFIQPAGWMRWDGNFALNTLEYREYGNTGPGANTKGRVKWIGYKVITNPMEAMQYTVDTFLRGVEWLKTTGGPFAVGLNR